jgi:hypothetical protein
MKKKIVLLIGFIAFVNLNSCKKDQVEASNFPQGEVGINSSRLSNVSNTIESFISDPLDPDAEKIDRTLQSFSEIAKKLFLTTKFNEWIIDKANTRWNYCVYIDEFIEYARTIANTEEIISLDQLEALSESVELTHPSLNPREKGKIEYYQAAIFVCNIKNCSPNELAYVSGGLDVNSQLPGFESYEDYIVAYKPESNSHTQVFINEEFAKSMTSPLFVFDNAQLKKSVSTTGPGGIIYEPGSGGGGGGNPPPSTNDITTAKYLTNEFRINVRNEKSGGKSEVCITSLCVDEFKNVVKNLKDDKGKYVEFKKIKEVPKDKINQEHSAKTQFVSFNTVPTDQNYLVWNMFERDWQKSFKSLGSTEVNTVKVGLRGEMKFTGDWFAFHFDYLDGRHLDLFNTYHAGDQGNRINFDDSKGYVKFYRTFENI